MRETFPVFILRGLAGLLLLGLPLLGVWLAGHPLAQYMQFPPLTQYVEHAAFSWRVFSLLLAIICMFAGYFFIWPTLRAVNTAAPCHAKVEIPEERRRLSTFVIAAGLALGGISWFIAWTRFPCFEGIQRFTFTPQWISYIIVVEGLTLRRTGRCMALDETATFAKLFAGSAFFWWFFEYLNRFVQNWHYVGIEDFSPLEYFLYATPPFATVLPAVLGTSRLLLSFEFMQRSYTGLPRLGFLRSKMLATLMLLAACASLSLIGTFPSLLFPMLWVSPLLIITSLQILSGRKTVFERLSEGDYRLFVSLALAALICGFFWEMWNYHSLAKWLYSVPYVNRFHLFEMPALGYAGYIPFGVECYCAAQFLLGYKQDEGTGSQ